MPRNIHLGSIGGNRGIKICGSVVVNCTCAEYDFIFAGPPYALTTIDELPRLVFEKKLLKPKGWFILEHTPRNDYKKTPHYRTERNYGTTIFSIFIQD